MAFSRMGSSRVWRPSDGRWHGRPEFLPVWWFLRPGQPPRSGADRLATIRRASDDADALGPEERSRPDRVVAGRSDVVLLDRVPAEDVAVRGHAAIREEQARNPLAVLPSSAGRGPLSAVSAEWWATTPSGSGFPTVTRRDLLLGVPPEHRSRGGSASGGVSGYSAERSAGRAPGDGRGASWPSRCPPPARDRRRRPSPRAGWTCAGSCVARPRVWGSSRTGT